MGVLRDISMIILAVEAFILALVPIVLFGGLVYGSWWLRRHENLPTWLKVMRACFDRACMYVERGMDAVVRPLYVIHSALATVQGWLKALTR